MTIAVQFALACGALGLGLCSPSEGSPTLRENQDAQDNTPDNATTATKIQSSTVASQSTAAEGARGERAPQPPPPPRQFPARELSFLIGHWLGDGVFTRTGASVRSTIVFEPAAAGEALLMSENDLPPNRTTLISIWSIDGRSGELVMMLAGNMNAGARLFRSKGWSGRKIVFETDPELRAAFALERFTFERRGNGGFDLTYKSSRDGLRWSVGDRQTYRRVA